MEVQFIYLTVIQSGKRTKFPYQRNVHLDGYLLILQCYSLRTPCTSRQTGINIFWNLHNPTLSRINVYESRFPHKSSYGWSTYWPTGELCFLKQWGKNDLLSLVASGTSCKVTNSKQVNVYADSQLFGDKNSLFWRVVDTCQVGV